MQDEMLRTTPKESAHISRALPNFMNFMRFLHPGPAWAAKFASSTAELGWDGSLLHCKRQGLVMPSFHSTWVESRAHPLRVSELSQRKLAPRASPGSFRDTDVFWTPQRREMSPRNAVRNGDKPSGNKSLLDLC